MPLLEGWMAKGEWQPKSILPIRIITSQFLGISKTAFLSINGYNETFPFAGFEDYDFAFRLNAHGINGVLNTREQIFHNEEENILINNWLKRRYRNGYTNAIGTFQLNYTERELHYTKFKSIAFQLIYSFRSCYKFLLWLIPNHPAFDSSYCKLFNPLLGAYIHQGYLDGQKI